MSAKDKETSEEFIALARFYYEKSIEAAYDAGVDREEFAIQSAYHRGIRDAYKWAANDLLAHAGAHND